VVVPHRLAARRIGDDDRGEALAGQVRHVVRRDRLDRLAVGTRGARRGCYEGRGQRQNNNGNEDLLECLD